MYCEVIGNNNKQEGEAYYCCKFLNHTWIGILPFELDGDEWKMYMVNS